MTEFNLDLAVTALANIRAFPHHWDQANWRCKTGMCYAGWVSFAGGGKWAEPKNPDSALITLPGQLPKDWHFYAVTVGNKLALPSEYAATLLLGLRLGSFTGDLFGSSLNYDALVEGVADKAGKTQAAVKRLVAQRAKELDLPQAKESIVFNPAKLVKA